MARAKALQGWVLRSGTEAGAAPPAGAEIEAQDDCSEGLLRRRRAALGEEAEAAAGWQSSPVEPIEDRSCCSRGLFMFMCETGVCVCVFYPVPESGRLESVFTSSL